MIALALLVLAVAHLGSVLTNFPVAELQRVMEGDLMDVSEDRAREEGERRQLTNVGAVEDGTSAHQNQLREYKYSVIRIASEVKIKNPFKPWEDAQLAMFSGSGFAIKDTERGPLMVTNCHVVLDATAVKISVPAYSAEEYKARVVMLNPDMDIAFLELYPDEKERMTTNLAGTSGLVPVEFYDQLVTLGQDVIALGFPLGQKNPKLTSGVLSGNEKVGSFISFQQTAQISPGNSGGPLFAAGTNKVIGINFATAAGNSSQNNNFAIPSWQVVQMMHEFDQSEQDAETNGTDFHENQPEITFNAAFNALSLSEAPVRNRKHKHHQKLIQPFNDDEQVEPNEEVEKKPVPRVKPFSANLCREKHERCIYSIPKVTAEVATMVTPELTATDKCSHGVLISKWTNSSIFSFAQPKLPERVFIEEIRGQKLDDFGMVTDKQYFDDPIRFDDLLFLAPTLQDVEIKVCSCGEKSTHTIPTSALKALIPYYAFDEQEEPNVYMMQNHGFYENFAGVTVMPLTLNLAKAIYKAGRTDIVPVLMSANDESPEFLVITSVSHFGTETPQGISPGDIIAKVNGQNVTTMAQFRQAFQPSTKAVCQAQTSSVHQFSARRSGNTFMYDDGTIDSLRTESSMVELPKSDASVTWSLETKTGREYVVYYQEALQTQARYVANGEVPMTMAAKEALGSEHALGLSFSEGTVHAPEVMPAVLPIEERTDVRRNSDAPWEFFLPDGMTGISM